MDEYSFNEAKYRKHTAHLSPIEDLAYRRLIGHYYINESPIDSDVSTAARKIGLRSHAESVSIVLNDFFESTEQGWFHRGIESRLRTVKVIDVNSNTIQQPLPIHADNLPAIAKQKPKKKLKYSAEDESCAREMLKISQSERPNLDFDILKSANEIRMIREKKKLSHDDILNLWRWTVADHHPNHQWKGWSSNCQTPLTLRKKSKDGIEKIDRIIEAMKSPRKEAITMEWRPSEDAYNALGGMGIPREFSEDEVPAFVLYWKNKQSSDGWDSKFLSHTKRAWQRLQTGTLMTPDWMPSDVAQEELFKKCLVDVAEEILPEFRLYWMGRGERLPSWDAKFIAYAKTKGQRIELENRNVSTREMTLEQEMSDKSWAN